MTDITKCNGENCEKKEQCYRYTAPWGNRQSFMESKICLNESFGQKKFFWFWDEKDKPGY